MYHWKIQFYMIGQQPVLPELIHDAQFPVGVTYSWAQSDQPDPALAAKANIIFLAPEGPADGMLAAARAAKRPTAWMILLAGREQLDLLHSLDGVDDIWTTPLPMRELHFRVQRLLGLVRQHGENWQNAQFLDALLNGSPDLIWYKSRNGIYEKVNESFCRMVGKTQEEIQGRPIAPGEDDPVHIATERQVMETRETCVAEEVIQTKDGPRQLATYKSPVYDMDGSVMGTVGVGVDVTQERAYEQEITRKNQTQELLLSTLDCGVMCHSLDGHTILSANPTALRLLGYSSQAEMAASGFDMVAMSVLDEDKEKLRAAIRTLEHPGDSSSAEYRVRHPDGKILHILGAIKLVEDNGRCYYQRFLTDFTPQRLKMDRQAQYQQQMFDLFSTFLSDNVDDVYIMLDSTAEKVEFVSPNIERVLGLVLNDAEHGLQQLSQARYVAGHCPSREELARMEPGTALEAIETERINPKTGEHRWFRETVYCVCVQEQKKIVSYISDRTQERKSQDALKEALDIAQVASKAKSAFLSSVSHDIRTPMNAIMGFVTLLQEEANSPEHVTEYTQKISAASQHLLGLINDVLDMNKIESGSTVLNISEINLATIIEELNAIIRPQAKMKEQTFDIYASSLTHEDLLGDKLRINQILINILSNAVKYTQKGGKIEMRVVELPQIDPKYGHIQFTISDNGQGMSEDYLNVIFDPFTREQTATISKIQGTGLGMAITKNLVDLMGGTIQVDSAVGQGSTFTVELELRLQDHEEDDPKFWEQHGITRMIVAEDDEDVCRDIVRKMSHIGVDTHFATSGQQAVDAIRSAREQGKPFDLILLDWKMPDLDGLETARLIRKNYPHKVPILLFTAYDWADIEQEALEVGIDHFLPKPFFMTNFKEAIQRTLGRHTTPAPVQEKVSPIKGRHILVVDDIDVNRMILVKILSTLGGQCETAENGQEAVDKFTAAPPGTFDFIFMDVQMPILNGYEATRAIRASDHPEATAIPIIAMTANAFVDDIRDALEAGMDAHVAKPIVIDQMESTVHEVLERKGLL